MTSEISVSLCLTVSNVFVLVALYTERQLSKVSRKKNLLALKQESSVDLKCGIQSDLQVLRRDFFSQSDSPADPPRVACAKFEICFTVCIWGILSYAQSGTL